MSTRILFADDSVTAQNMGKRILTEAGYDVVAVSNGAAAVKKIAEQKPDIIILDLYMPGYSGLEVCEKVRGSMATLKTPVLLTVGKMEPPPRPEDANRVRADGVIVKPFEASDLLAIVKKFEERITPSPPPLAQQAMTAEPDYATEPVVDLSPPHAVRTSPPQAMVDVPDHMASSSAFTDLLGIESAGSSPEHSQPAVDYRTGTGLPEPGTGIAEHEIPAAWRREEEAARAEVELPLPDASGIEPPQHDLQAFESAITRHEVLAPESTDVAPPPVPSRPLQIPVYQESAETSDSAELMPTAAPPIREIEIPRDPYLEATAAETTRNTIANSTEPGLVSGLQPEQYDPPAMQQQSGPLDSDFSITHSREISVDVPVDTPTQAPQASPEPPAASYVDADFEARVAAALASYNRSEGAASADSSSSATGALDTASETRLGETSFDSRPGLERSRTAVSQKFPENAQHSQEIRPVVVSDHMDNAVSAFEYRPPVGGSFPDSKAIEEPFSAPMPPTVAIKPDSEPGAAAAFEPAMSRTVQHEEDTNGQTASDRLRSAAETQARDSITHAVSRVIERLKPELVDEILRELNSKE